MKISEQLNIDFGQISLSTEEIIDFAERYDPLEFHTNLDIANKSMFKGLIASGPHIFNVFYRTKWIPLFGHTVLAGMEMNHWKFLKPIYADQLIQCLVTVKSHTINKEKGTAIVKWQYEFKNTIGENCQTVDLTILHKLD
jgi:acyl dehydratase